MTRTTRLAAAALLALTVSLAGCAGAAEPAATAKPTSAATPAPSAPEPTAGTDSGSTPEAAGPLSCETLISPAVTQSLQEQGWVAMESPLHIGSSAIPGGILCTWGPADAVGASGQMYGFGELDDAMSATVRAELVSQGWTEEQADQGIYLTAPQQPVAVETPDAAESATPAPSSADEAGRVSPSRTDAFSYLFGSGWVKFADTRDGLILIAAPGR